MNFFLKCCGEKMFQLNLFFHDLEETKGKLKIKMATFLVRFLS